MSTEPTTANPFDPNGDDPDVQYSGPTRTVVLPVVALIAVVALVVGLAGGFLIERSRVRRHSAVSSTTPPTTAAQLRSSHGTVTAVSGNEVTVQTAAGASENVVLDDKSVVLKGTSALVGGIATGQKVYVDAQAQPDGSMIVKRFFIAVP